VNIFANLWFPAAHPLYFLSICKYCQGS